LLVFVAAEQQEFDGLIARAERVVSLDWPLAFAKRAWLNGRPVLLVANGPGPRLAGQALDEVRKGGEELEGLASIGFCGALDPALNPCDIFIASQILRGDNTEVSVNALAAPRGPVTTGKLLSVDRVAGTISEKLELRKTGAVAVEMEAAAVALRAAQWNLPCYCVKVVTDTAAESFPLDFNRMRDEEGRFSRSKIIAAAFRRPIATFPKLMQLNDRCKNATKALGDFIADSRF